MNKEFISLGVQAGDKEANAAVAPHYMQLRKLFAEHCSRGYGASFKEMAFILRIDGEIWHWEKYGCKNPKAKRSGESSVEIYMPIEVWKGGDSIKINAFLRTELHIGFSLMLAKLESFSVEFDKFKLVSDFEGALAAF